jgi:hypothetical protein
MHYTGIIHEAASIETGRYAMNGIGIYPPKDGRQAVAATDGRILAVTLGEGEPVQPGVYTAPKGRGKAYCIVEKSGVTLCGAGKDETVARSKAYDAGTVMQRIEGTFPPVDAVVNPDIYGEESRSVTLNAAYLRSLADAIGDDVVTLTFPKDYAKPIAVTSASRPDSFGLIMPVKAEDRNIGGEIRRIMRYLA